MPLQTDLNRVPYYDDYDPDKKFHRILFRPGTAVQARELTQVQSIFQNQIESFGKHIFTDGSIVDGCDISFDRNMNYVKVTDNYTNGSAISVSDLEGKFLVANSTLKAYVFSVTDGSEGTPPDLKTAYIKYINSGIYSNGAQQSVFDADEILNVYTTANVNFGIINVANSTSSATGNSFSASVTSGVVFHRGVFIGVDSQKLIVSKYNNSPHKVTVGFTTVEEIITPEIDTSLLDNSQGSFNYNAPGAHRLKLTPTLVVKETSNVDSTDTSDFFSVADFQYGNATRTYIDPQYASLGVEMARRTYEESGNYVVNPFPVSTEVISSNTSHFNTIVDKGIGYVHGYRIEYEDKVFIPTRKGNDTEIVQDVTITGNFGNYVFVNELAGSFDFNNLGSVSLRNTVANAVSTGTLTSGAAPGSEIGTANIRTIVYYSGTPGLGSAQYKLYLSNIKMNSGQTFKNVRSIYGISGGNKGFADVVLTSGNAVLQETNLSSLVLPLGKNAIKNLRNGESAPNDYTTYYTFRTSNTVTFTASLGSVATLTIPSSGVGTSGQELPYGGGTLSTTAEADFVIIATGSANTANLTGTVSTSGNTVTGVGTDFNNSSSGLNYLQSGDFVYVVNSTASELRQVSVVTNSTVFTVNTNFVGTFPAGATVKRHIPSGSILNMAKPTANISVSNTTSANIYPGTAFNVDLNTIVYYNLKRSTAVGASKVINKDRYVKISLASNTTGPWCLGIPDVLRVAGVYIGNSSSVHGEYSTSNRNIVNQFTLDDGQRDDRYDLAYLKKSTTQTFSTTDRLLVKLHHFTHNKSSGVGFLSVESYPIDDANTSNTTAITTMEIPRYMTTGGNLLDLRDCIDFRPILANTANSATTVNTATINPSNSSTFDIISGGAYSFVPDEEFVTDFTFYKGRVDKVYMEPTGTIGMVEGKASLTPKTPNDKPNTMTLGILKIPPYPSLPYNFSLKYRRPDYAVLLTVQQIKRFTMRDIGVLEDRIKRLEYYTTLNMLELNTKQISVLDANGNDRFKNGFLADPFDDANIADTDNVEFINYSCGFDLVNSEIAPRQIINYVPLDVYSKSNVVQLGRYTHNKNMIPNRVLTFGGYGSPFLTQLGASKKRNVSEGNIFRFKGTVSLNPPGSHKIDVTTNPALTAQFATLGNVKVTNQVLIGASYRITDTGTEIPLSSNLSATVNPSQSAGTTFTFNDLIQDISVQPYLDPLLIKFSANGLKPNTNMNAFFDNIDINSYCQEANSSFAVTKTLGAQLKTDSTGNLYGFFFMPKGIFRTGERIFKLCDITNPITSSEVMTSEASTIFYGSNIDIAKSSINLQSQPHDVDLISVITRPVMSIPTPVINNTYNTNITNNNTYQQIINEITQINQTIDNITNTTTIVASGDTDPTTTPDPTVTPINELPATISLPPVTYAPPGVLVGLPVPSQFTYTAPAISDNANNAFYNGADNGSGIMVQVVDLSGEGGPGWFKLVPLESLGSTDTYVGDGTSQETF